MPKEVFGVRPRIATVRRRIFYSESGSLKVDTIPASSGIQRFRFLGPITEGLAGYSSTVSSSRRIIARDAMMQLKRMDGSGIPEYVQMMKINGNVQRIFFARARCLGSRERVTLELHIASVAKELSAENPQGSSFLLSLRDILFLMRVTSRKGRSTMVHRIVNGVDNGATSDLPVYTARKDFAALIKLVGSFGRLGRLASEETRANYFWADQHELRFLLSSGRSIVSSVPAWIVKDIVAEFPWALG